MSELISFTVNGRTVMESVPPNRILAEYLREDLGLIGCRIACDAAMCGACTVLLDGAPITSCSTFVFEAAGKSIETVESLADCKGNLHPIQEAFLEANAFQCAFCTAGILLSVKALLARDSNPNDATIRNWLEANLCRCTGYRSIIEATQLAAKLSREKTP